MNRTITHTALTATDTYVNFYIIAIYLIYVEQHLGSMNIALFTLSKTV